MVERSKLHDLAKEAVEVAVEEAVEVGVEGSRVIISHGGLVPDTTWPTAHLSTTRGLIW